MLLKLCVVNNSKFILYGEDFDLLDVQILDEKVDLTKPDQFDLPIIKYNKGFSKREKVLESEGIRSTHDLSVAYNRIRLRAFDGSARLRSYIEEKYKEVLEFM